MNITKEKFTEDYPTKDNITKDKTDSRKRIGFFVNGKRFKRTKFKKIKKASA